MTANELRIGNWIKKEDSITEFEVHGIYAHTSIVGSGNDIWFQLPISEFTGIPLTEEWLLKFGFIKNDYPLDGWLSPSYADGSSMIRITSEMEWVANTFKSVKIQHVHQLQNLFFALTGEELTIKEPQPTSK